MPLQQYLSSPHFSVSAFDSGADGKTQQVYGLMTG
jgi:hypothetical protein